MVIEYIVKGDLADGVSEVVHRVCIDGRVPGFEVLRDGEVSSSGPVPPACMARLESEINRLNGVPLVFRGEPPVPGAVRGTKHKLVVDHGAASFCFLWRGAPPEAWRVLLGVARAVVEIAGGRA